MKSLVNSIVLGLFLISPFYSSGQIENDFSQHELQLKTLQIIDSVDYCTMITVDSAGQPRVRIMSHFPIDSTFTIWLGTHAKSRKIIQINKNPKVTINFFNTITNEYVSIHGIAEIIVDEKVKNEHWKEEWDSFYPNRTEDYALIKITPIWIEAFSYEKGLVSDTITLKPISFYFE